jgi:Zn-dependent peptidase ImmA (M78 family)
MVGMMINNPRSEEYDKIVELALNVLMDYKEYDFPLNINGLAKKIGIDVKLYSNLDFDVYENIYDKSPFGFTILSKYNNGHITFETYYNDIDNKKERNRFTLAHEIGHVVNGDINKDITDKEEKLYDYFAKCLLAPQCLIIQNKEFDIKTIVTNYNVSKQVAEYWLQAINNRISSFGKNCLTDIERTYLEARKKYYNHQPASKGL